MGPTSGNCSPLRVAFLRSREAKEKLRPALDPGNVDKTMTAPGTAIIAYDLEFYEQFPKLAPKRDGHKIFAGKTELIAETPLRNGSLPGAYFVAAARALGLDCVPLSGLDRRRVDAAFFGGPTWLPHFLCTPGP